MSAYDEMTTSQRIRALIEDGEEAKAMEMVEYLETCEWQMRDELAHANARIRLLETTLEQIEDICKSLAPVVEEIRMELNGNLSELL